MSEDTSKYFMDSVSKTLDKILTRFDSFADKLSDIQKRQADDKLSVYQAIQEVKDMAIEQNHKLTMKVAIVMAAIGTASGGFGSFIEKKLTESSSLSQSDRTIFKYESSLPAEKENKGWGR